MAMYGLQEACRGGRVSVRAPRINDRCDLAELRRRTMAAMRRGVEQIELDLTGIDQVDAGLLACLVEFVRAAREHRVFLKVLPSLTVGRFLEACGLDNRLQPIQHAA